jgi:putative spermidine/putrescine transport system permease protein
MSLVKETTELGAEPPTSSRKRPRSGRSLPSAWLVVPALLFLAAVFAYPVIQMFWLSFTEFPGGKGSWYSNYTWYFSDNTQMAILRRTFLVSVWVTLACLLLGFPYAYLMTVVGKKARLVMVAAVMLPFWSNLVVRTYAWVILLSDVGPIQSFLKSLGFDPPRLLGNVTGMTIGATQVLLPFLVLPLYAGLQSIDRRLLDAAESLGARPVTAFVKVYLPLAMPGILAGAMLVFVLSLGFYFTPALLGSAGESLISQQIVVQTSRLLAFGRGGAMALVLLALTLLMLAVVALITRRQSRALGGGAGR